MILIIFYQSNRMFSSSLFCVQTQSTTSAFPSLTKQNKQNRNALNGAIKLSEESTDSSMSDSVVIMNWSLTLDDLDFSQKSEEDTPRKCHIKLAKSQVFILIIKYYYLINIDIEPYHLAKLQLLSKKCYDYFVPAAMSQLNLKMEMPPCSIDSFE